MEDKLREKLDPNVDKVTKNKTLFGAMKNAINGIIHVFKTERNLRIDYILGAVVLIASLFFEFSKTEMICLLLTIGFVIFAEMVNSTVEYVVDLVTDKYDERAKAAKDIAAGGVLIASGISVIVAYFLFVGKISQISTKMLETILTYKSHLLVVILFVLVILTVVLKGIFSKKNTNYVTAFPSARVTVSFGLATFLFLTTQNFLVGSITLTLAIIISSLKIETDKVSWSHVIFSAIIGILIVIAVYQITLLKPYIGGLVWKIW